MASYANGVIPKTNVSLTDVRQTLGHSNTQQYNSLGHLCVSTNINKWSKHKPVILTSDAPNRSTSWWTGNSGNCGLGYKRYVSELALVNSIEAGSSDWTYQRPTGGSVSPYRLFDFGGYCHKAPCAFGQFAAPDVVQIGKVLSATVNLIGMNNSSLSINDMSDSDSIKSMFFCAIIKRYDGNLSVCTSGKSIGSGGSFIDIPTTGYKEGTYRVYPALTDTKKTDPMSPPVAAIFVSLPHEAGKYTDVLIQAKSPDYSYTFSATPSFADMWRYSASIKNNTGITRRFTNIKVELMVRIDGSTSAGDAIPVNNEAANILSKENKIWSGNVFAADGFNFYRFSFTDYNGVRVVDEGFI